MSKHQIIDAILHVNRSASRRWLEAFPTSALRRYLDRLEMTLEPRGPDSIWIRPGETSPVVTRPSHT